MYHILYIFKIKCDNKSERFEKSGPPFCQKLNNFCSLEVVSRSRDPQLQVGENSN